jgi:hypothetical protein
MKEHLTFEAEFQKRSREVLLDMHAQSVLEHVENAQPQLEQVQARLKKRIDALRTLLDTIEREYLQEGTSDYPTTDRP